MSFEPIYEVATTDSPDKLCSGQVVVEAKMFAPPGITISKILSAEASVTITASEVFVGEVRYGGKVAYKVLLLGSEGETECLGYSADFSDKLLDEAIERGMKPIFDYRILDTDIISVESGEIKLATVVEVDLIKPVQKRIKYLKHGGEGVHTLERALTLCKECGIGEENVTATDSAAVNAEKIVGGSSRVIVTKKNCAEGFVSVEGKIISDFCLESDGNISSVNMVTPFASELSLEGCNGDCKAVVRARLSSVTPVLTESGDGKTLEVEYTVSITAIAYGQNEITAVCDAFSENCEILATTESVNVRKLCDSFSAEDCVTGTVTLDQSNPVADSVIAVCSPTVHVTSAFVKDGNPIAEGIVSAVILYYSAELNSKNSVEIELPFSLKLNRISDDDEEIDLRATVSNCTARIRRGGEFDVRADVIFDADVYKTAVDSVITEIKQGEEISPSEAALTVHYARGGEQPFDAAKALKTSPECIKEQNPNLEFPLRKGDRVIYYRHLKRN